MINLEELRFPERPAYLAFGAPILVEPVVGSGELICVAVVALGMNGESQVVQTIRENVAKCMLGEASERFLGLVGRTIASINNHLAETKTLQNWVPPFGGVQLGEIQKGHVTDLAMMLRTTARNHSFLLNLGDFLAADESTADESPLSDRWFSMVKDATISLRPQFATRFNRQFKLTKGSQTRFDYAGQDLAANFGRIIPGHGISALVKTAKSKLWDLEALRESTSNDLFPSFKHYELVLFRPLSTDPTYSTKEIDRLEEAMLELEETGDRQQLRVVGVTTAELAAQRIIQAEAA